MQVKSALSGLYGRVAQLRRAWYDRRPDRRKQLAQPVISVGNLVVGGSGKTPAVAMLARLLRDAGERPAVLTRGYGRRQAVDGVVVVADGVRVLEETSRSGDEPQMLARALPGVSVIVSSDRYLAGRLAERRFGCTVHLLDDGFQHLRLARDIDLLMVSPADLAEPVLPSGRLREPLAAARVADALLVAGTDEDAAVIGGTLQHNTVFRVVPRYDPPRLVEPFGVAMPAGTGRRAVAVAGIARPGRFFAALRAEGWDVARELAFRDHHWFTSRDLESIRRTAVDTKADLIITTEKDATRLDSLVARALSGSRGRPEGSAPQAGIIPFAFLPMHVVIDPVERFASWLDERLVAARAGREAA